MSASGTLYLVATPIGNLEDITGRAVRMLREVSVVACEDTRHTRGLLAHLGIRTPTLSLHEHNERARIPQILGLLREGRSVAVVSDAGTPAISDPGSHLVAAAVADGFKIVPIPGASAVTAVVSLADFPADRFAFIGFLPARTGQRRRVLASLARLPMALVLFEGPHRVRDTLADIESVLGPRRVVLAREITKVHEEVLRGTAAEVRAALSTPPRGEITLLVEGAVAGAVAGAGEAGSSPSARVGEERASPEEFAARLVAQGLSRRDAARALAEAYGLPSRDAYRIASGVV
ncbi:MAG: 16S rRNA (cytidine(1402)-2'-O)-methyltransferase [bacterium]|nr:16S rRNA (cytidine(1402)-2'-O)-methyltransferase [bacterium]